MDLLKFESHLNFLCNLRTQRFKLRNLILYNINNLIMKFRLFQAYVNQAIACYLADRAV